MIENEIPDVCTKYDEIISKISKLETEIKENEEQIESLTVEIEKYINIVKGINEIGVETDYFIKKIKEIDIRLLRLDELIKHNSEKLDELYPAMVDIEKQIHNAGFWKVSRFLTHARWYPEEEAKIILAGFGASRLF